MQTADHKSNRSEPGRQMADGMIHIMLAEALIPLTGLVTAVFLSRRLDPADYGRFSLAVVLTAAIEFLIVSFLSGTTVKFISQSRDWRPVGMAVVRLYLLISVAATAALWLFGGLIARLLSEPVLADYLRLFALHIPVFVLAHGHRSILLGLGQYRQRAYSGAARWVARLILIVIFVELGFSVRGAILGSIGASLVELLLNRSKVQPAIFGRSSFPLRRLWGYAAPTFLAALSLRFLNLDLLILKALGGSAEDAAMYSAASNFAVLPLLLGGAICPTLLSTLTYLRSRRDGEAARLIARNALRCVVWLLPFVCLIAAASSEIVVLVYGAKFAEAGPLLANLVFAGIAMSMISVVNSMSIAAGRPSLTFAVCGPLAILAMAGHLALIPWWGARGASLTTAATSGLGAALALMVVNRVWRVHPPVATLMRVALASLLMFAIGASWEASGPAVIVKLGAGTSLILVCLFVLGEFDRRELRWLLSLRFTARPAVPSPRIALPQDRPILATKMEEPRTGPAASPDAATVRLETHAMPDPICDRAPSQKPLRRRAS